MAVQRTVSVATFPGVSAPGVPTVALTADAAGPTVVVTGNVHGDEAIGVRVGHELGRWLQGALIRGKVVVYPTLNPAGLMGQTRLVPGENVDLNRLFPGDLQGIGAVRYAGGLWNDILRHRPDVVIDLHADSHLSVPYALVDRPVAWSGERRRELDRRLDELAQATGLTVVREYPDAAYTRFQLDRSLAGALVNRQGVPALTIEAGPRRITDEPTVRIVVGAVIRVLAHLGLVEPVETTEVLRLPGGPWRRAGMAKVRRGGVLVPQVHAGQGCQAGQVLAHLVSLDGEIVETVVAEFGGLVLCWLESAWIGPGVAPGTLVTLDLQEPR
jgi:predicted deacylase